MTNNAISFDDAGIVREPWLDTLDEEFILTTTSTIVQKLENEIHQLSPDEQTKARKFFDKAKTRHLKQRAALHRFYRTKILEFINNEQWGSQPNSIINNYLEQLKNVVDAFDENDLAFIRALAQGREIVATSDNQRIIRELVGAIKPWKENMKFDSDDSISGSSQAIILACADTYAHFIKSKRLKYNVAQIIKANREIYSNESNGLILPGKPFPSLLSCMQKSLQERISWIQKQLNDKPESH